MQEPLHLASGYKAAPSYIMYCMVHFLGQIYAAMNVMATGLQFERDSVLLATCRKNLLALENLQRVRHDSEHVTRLKEHLQSMIRKLEQKLRSGSHD